MLIQSLLYVWDIWQAPRVRNDAIVRDGEHAMNAAPQGPGVRVDMVAIRTLPRPSPRNEPQIGDRQPLRDHLVGEIAPVSSS